LGCQVVVRSPLKSQPRREAYVWSSFHDESVTVLSIGNECLLFLVVPV